MRQVKVIGAGFAGCEAANALARRGFEVTLCEQKPLKFSPAHKNADFAELVCSNSFKSDSADSAAGLLKAELKALGGILPDIARAVSVPAGGALAVDRTLFSREVTARISADPNITVVRGEVCEISADEPIIVAAGPLAEGALAKSIAQLCGDNRLSFFDAAAPIVSAESIDFSQVFPATRYDRGEADYLNCYFDKAGYEQFHAQLCEARTAALHNADYAVYEGCMPIEKLARRGAQCMRYGPMKPVGLRDPRTGHRPWAAVQLRREDDAGTMYNLVGFQTNLAFAEQKRVFSMIPGLQNAQFVRYGVMHRNTFLNSPRVLLPTLNLKAQPLVWFAGQITGFEGYMESALCGALAGRFAADILSGITPEIPSEKTMSGALLRYITAENKDFQPMGANMGLLPPPDLPIKDKKKRYASYYDRALKDMEVYVNENSR